MSRDRNRQVWLKSRPNGIPRAEDFAIREAELPTLIDGKFLVRNSFLSVDPAMRGWIADKSTYWPRIEVGDTMRAFSVGEVVETRNADFAVGDKVMGIFGWQDFAAADSSQVMRKVREPDLADFSVFGGIGIKRPDRLRRTAGGLSPEGRRDGRRVNGCWSGRVGSGSDRKNQGLPGCGHCGRGGQGAAMLGRVQLRRCRRLQGGKGPRRGPGVRVSQGYRRVF